MALQHSTKDDNLTSMYNCLKTGAFSDLTITCGNKTWNAHRVVVCPKSPFFRAACAGNFKEAATGVINLEDDDPLAVKLMMDFLYKGDYEEHEELPGILGTHVQMYCLGDKYDIEDLRREATYHYEICISQEATLEEYLASIPEVYLPKASNDLRKSAITCGRLKLSDGWLKEPRTDLKRVMKDVPEFGFDLVEDLITALAESVKTVTQLRIGDYISSFGVNLG